MRSLMDGRMPRRFRSRKYRFYLLSVVVLFLAALAFLWLTRDTGPQNRVSVAGRSWFGGRGQAQSQLDVKRGDDRSLEVHRVTDQGEKQNYRVEKTPGGVVVVDTDAQKR